MPSKMVNWKVLSVVLIGIFVLSITAVGLRRWQRRSRATSGLELGTTAYDRGDYETAAAQLGRYITVVRDDIEILLKYADSQLKRRPVKKSNIGQATQSYRAVLRLDKGNAEATDKLVSLYLSLGAASEAEFYAQQSLQSNQSASIRHGLALALAGQDKLAEAIDLLEQLVLEYPSEIRSYELLSRLILHQDDSSAEKALGWLDKAIESNPSDPSAYMARAAFNIGRNDFAAAIGDLERTEGFDFSDVDLKLRLAKHFISVDLRDKAEPLLEQVASSEPENASLWQIRIALAIWLGDIDRAGTLAQEALERLSSYDRWDFMPIAIETLIQAGRLDLAVDCVEEVGRSDIFSEHIAFWSGLIAKARGENSQAIRHLRKSLDLGMSSAALYLNLSGVLASEGDFLSAIYLLNEFISENPDNFEARVAIAELFSATGHYDRATEHLLTALEISSVPEVRLKLLASRMRLADSMPKDRRLGIFKGIIAEFEDLKVDRPDLVESSFLPLRVFIRMGDFNSAQRFLDDFGHEHSSEFSYMAAESELLIARGMSSAAKEKLSVTIVSFPEAVEPVKSLAALYLSEDDRVNCERLLTAALERFAKSSSGRRQLGLLLADAYRSWGQSGRSVELLRSLSNELPGDIPIRRRLLTLEEVCQDQSFAQQLIDQIKELEGLDGWQWRLEQARLWISGDDFDNNYHRIVSILNENLSANASDNSSRMLLASVYNRTGQLGLAAQTCRNALGYSPDNIEIMIATIKALNKAGDFDQSDDLLKQAHYSGISHPELSDLELKSRYRRGELAEVEQILKDQISSHPEDLEPSLQLAAMQIEQGKYDQADALLVSLRASHRSSQAVGLMQIELQLRREDFNKALSLSNKMVEGFGSTESYLSRVGVYEVLGRLEQAELDYLHVCKLSPDNPDIWLGLSDFYQRHGEFRKAVEAMDRTLSISPGDVEVLKRATGLLLRSADESDLSRGRRLLDKALSGHPDDIDLQFQKATMLFSEGTDSADDRAVTILSGIVSRQPRATRAWVRLGRWAYHKKRYRKAADYALQGLVHSPANRELLLLKADAESALSPSLSIATLKTLREAYPDDLDIALRLVEAFAMSNQADMAFDLIGRLKSAAPVAEHLRLDIAAAIIHHANGDSERAFELLESLERSNPDDSSVLLAHVALLRDEQRWPVIAEKSTTWCRSHSDDFETPFLVADLLLAVNDRQSRQIAEDLLGVVLNLSPDNTKALHNMALLLQTTARSAEAVSTYERLLSVQPENVIAINNLAWLLCQEQNECSRALELAERGLAQSPYYADLLDTRGVVYYHLGDFEKSVVDFNRCIELYSEGSAGLTGVHFHLGRALLQLDRSAEAAESLNRAFDLNSRASALSPDELRELERLLTDLSNGG